MSLTTITPRAERFDGSGATYVHMAFESFFRKFTLQEASKIFNSLDLRQVDAHAAEVLYALAQVFNEGIQAELEAWKKGTEELEADLQEAYAKQVAPTA